MTRSRPKDEVELRVAYTGEGYNKALDQLRGMDTLIPDARSAEQLRLEANLLEALLDLTLREGQASGIPLMIRSASSRPNNLELTIDSDWADRVWACLATASAGSSRVHRPLQEVTFLTKRYRKSVRLVRGGAVVVLHGISKEIQSIIGIANRGTGEVGSRRLAINTRWADGCVSS